MRSMLTMLGVIIAVVSVVTTISLGEGIKQQVASQINHLGSDLITIRPGKLVERGPDGHIDSVNFFAGISGSDITDKDIASVTADPNVRYAAPLSIISGTPHIDKQEFPGGHVIATNQNLPNIINKKVEFGSFFGPSQPDSHVAVIGPGVAEKLFKENIPIGKSFEVRNQRFIVIGVFEDFEANLITPEVDFNNALFIPQAAGQELSGGRPQIYEVLVKPKDTNQIAQTASNLENLLRANRGGQDDFTVLKQQDAVDIAGSIFGLLNAAVVAFAAVALFVGGISIMNVMLASVTERTREIGIRKAVGATNRQIRSQFLVEAIVLSLWGALIGVFVSGLINISIRILTDLQPVITWQSVLLATASSMLIGVIFGVVPAIKASRKDPINSLRAY
jgi:putative ABC transport system permease protein